MSLQLSPETEKVIEQVKALTGKSIRLTEKNDLDTYASVKIARKKMPYHLLFYKQEPTGILDYLVAHECGHILRTFGSDPQYRLVPLTNEEFKKKGLTDMQAEIERLSKRIPFQNIVQIANLWYHGTIKQLTNFPSDIWIEQWIYNELPSLRENQATSLRKQYKEASDGLSRKIEEITPRVVLDASNGMNFAMFHILAEHLEIAFQLAPYYRSRYNKIGSELELIQTQSDNSYKGDIDTVKKWADVLRVSHWFAWTDFEDIPDDYQSTFV